MLTRGIPPTACPLTRRQCRVLELMAEGLGYEQIAEHLCVSTRTVERDAARAAKVLGASSQVALGALAFAAGILHSEHLPNRDGPHDDERLSP